MPSRAALCCALASIALSPGASAGLAALTYLGGSRTEAITGIAVDAEGYIYVAGWTESSNLPVVNAWQAGLAGGVDAFVAKITPDGKSLIYCTYLGGRGDDRAFGIAVDGTGNAYVTGWTTSSDFPTQKPFQPSSGGGKDAFVAKLNPSGALVFSSYYGGAGQDSGNAIAVDAAGNVFVAGETDSANLNVKNALQASSRGGSDAFVLQIDPNGSTVLFATYLGGRLSDRATAIALDSSGCVYVTGSTGSPDFPVLNAFQMNLTGAASAFVAKIDPAARKLVFSGFLGGSGNLAGSPELGTAIAVDAAGAAYVAGITNSTDFPVVHCLQCSAGGLGDAFVVKVNPSGLTLDYATYLGGRSTDYATSIAVDAIGRAWVAGYTFSSDFPRAALDTSSYLGLADTFLASIDPDGTQLHSSTLFGSTGFDAALGIALNGSNIYVAGQTGSVDLRPTGTVQPGPGGLLDGFIAVSNNPVSNNPTAGLRFIPVVPCRVVDTRNPDGPFGGPMLSPPANGADFSRDFVIPSGPCGIPTTPAAYSLNVSVIPQGISGLGFLTVWPAGPPRPNVATVNSRDGRVKGVSAIVGAGAGSSIRVFVTDTTHVILDINGYFVSASDPTALAFFPLPPCRIADTRGAAGPLGGPSLTGHVARDFPILLSECSLPANAQAYSLNLAAVPNGRLGFLTAWPTGQPQPNVSALNAQTGTPTANAAILPAGTGGSISVWVTDNTDLVIDINGYFAAPASGGLSLYSFGPCRVLDTRAPAGPGIFSGVKDIDFTSAGCGIPPAPAYVVNATVIPPARFGFLSLWPAGTPQPSVATLNAWDGAITSNLAIVPANNGSVSVFARDPTNLVIDIFGYFAP